MLLKVAITLSLSALTLYYLYRYYLREHAKLVAKLEQDRIEFVAMLAASREAHITDLTAKVDATIEEIRKGRRS
jgi:hypothetical protein